MSGERQIIRNAIKQALEAVYSGPIYTTRRVDTRGLDEFVRIYLKIGEIDYEGLDNPTTASLVVVYHKKPEADNSFGPAVDRQVTDEELDVVADALSDQLGESDIVPDLVRGIVPTGFEYGEEQEQEFESIALLFTIHY